MEWGRVWGGSGCVRGYDGRRGIRVEGEEEGRILITFYSQSV